MNRRYAAVAVFFLMPLLLSACGGGGGGDGAATFALLSGYQARIAAGASDDYVVSGSCAGTATLATGAASPDTFESVNGYAATQTFQRSLSNCTPASTDQTGTNYFDADYMPLGTAIPNVEYATRRNPAAVLPNDVKVGATGDLGTLDAYADSTKTTRTGHRELSYAIETDGNAGTTAIANFITRSYDASGALFATQQTRYRMAPDGTLSATTIDVQFSGTAGTDQLVYTKN